MKKLLSALLLAFALPACGDAHPALELGDPTPHDYDSVFSTLPGEAVAKSEQPLRGCGDPGGVLHELAQPYVMRQVGSNPDCDAVYYGSEPVRWEMGADAPAPRRADGHLQCRWRTAMNWPYAASGGLDECRAYRTFVCDYMQGYIIYSVSYWARSTDWSQTDVQIQLSGTQTPKCTRLLTTSFPTAG
jgi:hypothetical protein